MSGFPHSPQNRSPASILAPHAAHTSASAAPQWTQNFRPARFSRLQEVQNTSPLPRGQAFDQGDSPVRRFRQGPRAQRTDVWLKESKFAEIDPVKIAVLLNHEDALDERDLPVCSRAGQCVLERMNTAPTNAAITKSYPRQSGPYQLGRYVWMAPT